MALGATAATASEPAEVRSAVLRVDTDRLPPISRLDLPPEDLGFAGGELGTADNQTTGQFMGQTFATEYVTTSPEDIAATVDALIADGIGFIVSLADTAQTIAISDAAGDRAMILNAGTPDDALRNENCRANMLHVSPSRAMRTDALAQFLVWKNFRDWFLIHGDHPDDILLAEAYRRAARKFGAEIVEERVFEDTGGARNTDSGHVQVQKQIPVFTQRAEDHDIIIAADESDVFAPYLPYQAWESRPVAGSAGLRPVSWHAAQEAWGAPQFQNRFERQSGRYMREEDYQVWLAIRVLGEAATRTNSTDFATMRDFILSPDFEVAGFKGQRLTFRPWNRQLRQPVLLATDRLLVSVSPQDEYLHRVSRLDTMGIDAPESTCNLNP